MVWEMDSHSADQKQCWRGIFILSFYQSVMAMEEFKSMSYI